MQSNTVTGLDKQQVTVISINEKTIPVQLLLLTLYPWYSFVQQ